jgi:Xaa-Pro aminopeptidase
MFDTVIEAGDLLHCDIGIIGKYVQLHTDIQWLAYVKKQGEEHAPKGIAELLALSNRFQDIAACSFKNQLSGNEVFVNAIKQAKDEGLQPMLYSHPLGTFGHGAGPTIGLYDNQVFVKGSGERPVENSTCYALELNISSCVPEWNNQEAFAYLEEDIYFDEKADFISGRQTELIEI